MQKEQVSQGEAHHVEMFNYHQLLLRLRGKFNGLVGKLWGRALLDAGDFVMMRKMLLGIKERAEQQVHLANLSAPVSPAP